MDLGRVAQPVLRGGQAQQQAQGGCGDPQGTWFVAAAQGVGERVLVLPCRGCDQVNSGAAAVVREAGGVFQPADRQVGLERGETGAVDVGRRHLVPARGEFGPGPFRAGLPDLVRAAGGLLARDVRDPGVRHDVVAAAFAGGVQQGPSRSRRGRGPLRRARDRGPRAGPRRCSAGGRGRVRRRPRAVGRSPRSRSCRSRAPVRDAGAVGPGGGDRPGTAAVGAGPQGVRQRRQHVSLC